ncbi:MAG: hypothetical protein ACI8UO_002409 [Verrucomicrobiales bacterium]|jgi:hypothetical protein
MLFAYHRGMKAEKLFTFVVAAIAWIPLATWGQADSKNGKLGKPLGKSLTIEGIIVSGPSKGHESGPNILVQRIDGDPTQAAIRLLLANVDQQLLPGRTYRIKGSEGGSLVGGGDPKRQTTRQYFRREFQIQEATQVEAVEFHPKDFKGKEAIFRGTAVTEKGKAWIQAKNGAWRILVSESIGWQPNLEGKEIETRGVHKSMGLSRKDFTLAGTWNPANLEDRLGETVELRGTAKSMGGVWWFSWQGTDLYVRDMEKLPGWTLEHHWKQVIIRGKIRKLMMPRIDQMTTKSRPDLAEYFVIDEPSWEPLPAGTQLLSPELPIDQLP